MCLYPRVIENRKYTATKKNGGVIPPLDDKRKKYVPIGCGNCMECRKKKKNEWAVRLHEDIKKNKNSKFVTLTFSEESLAELAVGIGLKGYDLENEIATKGVRRFLERWRKKHKKSVRHWLITELGQTKTERIHIHGLIWSDKVEDIKNIWKYGHVYIGDYVNGKTINYIVKYVNKVDIIHKEYKSKILTSNGIGRNYIEGTDKNNNKYKEEGNTEERYRTREGMKLALPIYYRNKIYSEEEREKLWIEKLDKEERYVGGRKISIKEGEEEYYKVLEEERKKNRRLGYGSNKVNWNRRKYENERRNINKLKEVEKKWKKKNGGER